MAIIKIDGSMLTSHQGASDITDVVNTSQITEGSNLYYTEARVNANFATKTTTDLTEGTNLYFTNARAVDAVEDEATIDLNSLIVNSDSSLAYPWKTLELKADRRTTAPVNNDANDIYWSARTPNATVSLGLIEIKTDNVTLDGNNDYTVFDNRLDCIVTSMTGGSTSFHKPVSMKKDKVEQLLTKVTRNATSTGHPFATVSLIADRSTTTPSNNQSGNDLYWEAKTATQSTPLADIEVSTRDVTLDGNNDYTDFSNRMSFYTTSMSGGAITWNVPLIIDKDFININTNLNSIDNSFFVGGSYGSLVNSTRIETNSGKWNTSRSGARCKTNATTDATGNTLSQFSDNFATDVNLSLNNSEVGAFSIAVLSPDFNGDNTLAYGNGQKSELNMLLRGDGHGVYPETALQALSIQPWDNKVTFNTATGTSNLLLETNATAIKENKPHVFVNLTTTARNALTAESGMMIFNTTDVKLQCYDGTAWNNLH